MQEILVELDTGSLEAGISMELGKRYCTMNSFGDNVTIITTDNNEIEKLDHDIYLSETPLQKCKKSNVALRS